MPSIIFVCTANQFRSPLAAACLLSWAAKTGLLASMKIESAGTWTRDGMSAASIAIGLAAKNGLPSLLTHRTRQVSLELVRQFDLIIVMETGQKEALISEFPVVREQVYMLSEIVDGVQYDIPDPAKVAVDPELVAMEIIGLVEKGARKILDLAETLAKSRADDRHV